MTTEKRKGKNEKFLNENGSDFISKYNYIKDELKVINNNAKIYLFHCLAKSAGLEFNEDNKSGFVVEKSIDENDTKMLMKFGKINGSATGYATAKDIIYLRWIPVCCEYNGKEYYYRIDLLCQDLDNKTGNFHINPIGGLQIWRDMIEDANPKPEVGGSITRIECDEKKKVLKKVDEYGEYISVHYYQEKAFPVAKRGAEKSKPWGYDIGEVPVLDMSNTDFDMQKAADFFMKLILEDMENKIKNQ